MAGAPKTSRKGIILSNHDHWITTRITETKQLHPLVTEAVLDRIGQLLKGPLSERQVPAGERKSVAAALITDMVPDLPKAENQE